MPTPFIALTDRAWFNFLAGLARERNGPLDEVNFWQPLAKRPMAKLAPGTPVFFRLKSPTHAIAGYGFFASFILLSLDQAWASFGRANGDPDQLRFLERIGGYRKFDLIGDARAPREPIGCTLLRDAAFWPQERWIPWGEAEGWAPNIVQGKAERDGNRASRLLGEIHYDHLTTPEELAAETFTPLDVDDRELIDASSRARVGQGTFRSRLLGAYGRRCAITGEHTEIVLDAAHIQPYLGPLSNHVQNGLLLTKEFHTLFDRGYVTVTPELEVRVSTRLKAEWDNGVRYYAYDARPLRVFPGAVHERPAPEVLEWHGERVFRD
ncbi:HNH endonuclease [Engelhardtia mirabilis]|uniref:HNH nuclease domain-containing protein n=1 Tax=Engelhardtia mirabilis TaxID=2528011 RepID=A0A518BE97_9BACT|nr:hypothetical protein Pla133_03500 [Planctomycetes bacterium Pla133]QDU99612.1 hypothetical protein Pla86_03500 [Planctomycetes bacterium Pla86]